jgi:DUF2075 family protein
VIIYQSTAKEFKDTVDAGQILPAIEEAFRSKLGRGIPPAERGAYSNSLPQMERVVRRAQIADDCGIMIEYKIPLTNFRVDFIVSGEDEHGAKNFIIVELKQWSSAKTSDGDGLVESFTGGANRIVTHPSYQASSYKDFISDFNENIANNTVAAYSCAYLHNYPESDPEPLREVRYAEIIEGSPVFLRDDQEKLEEYLKKYVKYGNGMDILYEIESGKIKPSKKLVDYVAGMFDGKEEYRLLDEQKVAFERARHIANNTKSGKSVVIIKGGPGTGKSVISLNLLNALLGDGLNAVFVAPNASFRETLVKKLAGTMPRMRLKNLFMGSSNFVESNPNEFDTLVVDEAHRLKKRGAYMYQGMNQVDDVIKAARTTIFFIDDNQMVRPDDVGSVAEVKKYAELYGAEVYEMELAAQFRCSGAEGYINWLDDVLQLRETANYDGWEDGEFEFKIFDDPNEMREAIKAKDAAGFSARILAGYAWEWTSQKEGNADAQISDVLVPEYEFTMPWNSRKVGSTWAIDDSGIDQVGCIHTSQGLEFDHVGVIIGDDLAYNDETSSFYTDYAKYYDKVGKKGLKDDPKELNRLVRNIYKVLMTRGMKGCYVYCTSSATTDYIRTRALTQRKV